MRNISFSLTLEQVRSRQKTVTRRTGWVNLKPKTILQAVEKAQGLKKGEKIVPIDQIVVVSVRRERLDRIIYDVRYGQREVRAEGFPGMTRQEFVNMFCRSHKGCVPETIITRIEFRYP